jgi:flagellar biosynthesis/type III secretory pathway protein FliH
MIREQEQRFTRYEDRQRQWEHYSDRRADELRRQRRYAYNRYQREYEERQRRHWQERANWRNYQYDNDPYFYTPASWRYRYSGHYYEVNDQGRDLLQQAVNSGYEEGLYAGRADREDGFGGGYRQSYVYQDADYGYQGLYVDQEQYQYYFRQGFQRGYDDGYNRRYQYGHKDDHGKIALLAGVLAGILIIDAIH